MLEAYPQAVRVKDKQNQTPLHRAAAVGNVPLVNLLAGKYKSPLNTSDRSGWTPLFHAVAEGHGDTAIALLRLGADADKVSTDGKTFLDVCADDKVKKWVMDMARKEGLEL